MCHGQLFVCCWHFYYGIVFWFFFSYYYYFICVRIICGFGDSNKSLSSWKACQFFILFCCFHWVFFLFVLCLRGWSLNFEMKYVAMYKTNNNNKKQQQRDLFDDDTTEYFPYTAGRNKRSANSHADCDTTASKYYFACLLLCFLFVCLCVCVCFSFFQLLLRTKVLFISLSTLIWEMGPLSNNHTGKTQLIIQILASESFV